MDKVVILARVSTQAQDYQRQVTELQEYCDRAGWKSPEFLPCSSSKTSRNAISARFFLSKRQKTAFFLRTG
jgi:DNA invertase Pin-like site-specific DNA recombinase